VTGQGAPDPREVVSEAQRERFWSNVQKTDTCWLWTKAVGRGGYGVLDLRRNGTSKKYRAHRLSLLLSGVEIPEGYEVDHLCKVLLCVRPDHLEPVPPIINWLRSNAPSRINLTKTECLRGHPFDTANTYITKRGKRCCRACKGLRDNPRRRAERAARRAERAAA
jgi:hypothetical protein